MKIDKALCKVYDLVYRCLFWDSAKKREAKTELYSTVETEAKNIQHTNMRDYGFFREELKNRFNIIVKDGEIGPDSISIENLKLPPSRNTVGRKLISITLNPETVDQLADYCLEHDLKKSSFIESLIIDAIKKDKEVK